MAATAAVAPDLSHDRSWWEFSCDFGADFDSEENASMVYAALAVDNELQLDKVKRQCASLMGNFHYALRQ